MREYLCSEEFKENLIEAIEECELDADELTMLTKLYPDMAQIISDAADKAQDYDDVDAEQVVAFLNANKEFRDMIVMAAAEEVYELCDFDDDEGDEE